MSLTETQIDAQWDLCPLLRLELLCLGFMPGSGSITLETLHGGDKPRDWQLHG